MGVPPRHDSLPRRGRPPGASSCATPGRGAARHAAPARASPRLHPRAALGRGRAAVRRGLLPRERHRRRRRPTAAGASPTTAPASSSAIRSWASPTSARTCARWKRRSSPRSPTEGIDAHSRSDEGPDYTGVWVGATEDRLDRRARLPRHLHPRLRGERRERPRPLLLGRRLRTARRRDDVPRPRGPNRLAGRCD